MKRLYLFIAFVVFSLVSCSDFGEISYKIVNKTDYDVVVIDNYVIPTETYNILANQTFTLKHFNSAKFELQNTDYPITISNGFDTSYIDYLPKYNFEIFNYTQKDYILKILNSKYEPSTFSINSDSDLIIQLYILTPDIQLYYDDIQVFNYLIKDNKIIIL